MDLARREAADRGAAPEFVALDIGGEAEPPPGAEAGLMMDTSLSGKAVERERSGDANSASIGVAGVHEKQAVPVHVDGSPREQYHPSTPKRRRVSRRVSGWRDPRKILFAFAALSSVGTLILLYFTLSMGKMTGGQADGQ